MKERCTEDFVYFINTYCGQEKYSPLLKDFKLYKYQEDVLNVIEDNQKILINTCRQMGITTTLMFYILWKINFNENYKVLVVNTNQVQAIHNLNILRYAYDRLPEDIKTDVEDNKKILLTLKNGSSVRCAGYSLNATIGYSYDLIIFDNAAYCTNLEHQYDAVLYNLLSGGKIVINSTLHKEGFFTNLCKSAEKQEGDFVYKVLPYYLNKAYGRLWRSNRIAVLGSEDIVIAECDCTHYWDKNGVLKPLIEEDDVCL